MFKGIKSMLFEKEYSLTEVFAACLTALDCAQAIRALAPKGEE